MGNLLAVLARVEVDDIDSALPFYVELTGADDVRRFAFGDVSLAWVGSFLLVAGPVDALRRVRRNATLLVADIDVAASAVTRGGGTVLEGPGDAPNGPRMVARHHDGAVFEYIEPR